ncbi:MAG: hypothetical protein Q8S36_10885 [Sulfuricurvum sp.]|nr:hypothetical protein [Sulfuricurvum sp.]
MKQNLLKAAVLTVFVLLIISIIFALWENSIAVESQEENKVLSKQLNEIVLLKTRWSTKESKNDLEYLKNHPNLVKQERRGSNTYFEYDNLSSKDFNQLSNTILNSMLVIKKLTLRRNGSSKGTILLEIES